MTRPTDGSGPNATPPPFALIVAGLLGLYLTTQGYRSLEGDQAFRLPLVLDRQDPTLYAADPFVRAFDAFNPHRGYLALLDAASRLVGLPAALAGLFFAVFALTCRGFERLGRAAAPGVPAAGWAVVGLVLVARAGNIGTNHLFEPTLLDRLIALSLFWNALAGLVERPDRAGRAALWLIPAAFMHPNLGLQLGLLLAGGRLAWRALGWDGGGTWRGALGGAALLLLAVAPGVAPVLAQGDALFAGMSREEYRRIAGYLQNPQHLIPSLWRATQWAAWACFPVLVVRFAADSGSTPHPAALRPTSPTGGEVGIGKGRLAVLLGLILAGLAASAGLIEMAQNARVTLFQPFRLATVARGLCLVLIAPGLLGHLRSGDAWRQARAALLAAGLVGDVALVVATLVELASTLGDRRSRRVGAIAGCAALGAGLWWLVCHDTALGHRPLLLALAGLAGWRFLRATLWRVPPAWTPARLARLTAYAWIVPLLAMVLPCGPGVAGEIGARLAAHCRFREVPRDADERLALWCREHLPRDARLVAAPGAKSFRLWSRRALAFNRAGCPYHAAALADWMARYRDHVGFAGPDAAFIAAYLSDRHRLERGYDAHDGAGLAGLASRQGSGYVVARAGLEGDALDVLHAEGDRAVYRVRPGVASLAQRDAPVPR
jgi:hypothetical protein